MNINLAASVNNADRHLERAGRKETEAKTEDEVTSSVCTIHSVRFFGYIFCIQCYTVLRPINFPYTKSTWNCLARYSGVSVHKYKFNIPTLKKVMEILLRSF